MKGYIRACHCIPPKERPYDVIGVKIRSAFGDCICFTGTPDEALELAQKLIKAVNDCLHEDATFNKKYIKPRIVNR